MNKELTVITGSNRGIGLEFARLYADRGDDVIAACRQSSPELDALGVSVHTGLDVTSADAISRLSSLIGERVIQRLVLNAGVLSRESLDAHDLDRIRQQFEVNALGPLRIAHALRQNLKAGSQVAIITSRMGSVADNTSGSMYGYRMSKAAVNMAGRSLSHDLQDEGIAVGLLHPGYVRTGMTGGNGNWNADEAASALIARIDEITLENSGTFRHANGESLPW